MSARTRTTSLFKPSLTRFLRSEEALAVTEYGLLVAFCALVIVAVVIILGGGLSTWFASKTSTITTN